MNNREVLEALSSVLVENIGSKLTSQLINGIMLDFNRLIPPEVERSSGKADTSNDEKDYPVPTLDDLIASATHE